MSEENEKPKTGDVDIMDLVPCLGVGCCIFSMYTELPDCLGSVCNNVICCIACKIMTCKASKEPDVFCKCISTDCDIVPFSTCCKAQGQTFCIDMRVSFPPSDQIPCLLTLCCLTCCYKYNCTCKCCTDVLDIEKSIDLERTHPSKDYALDGEWVEMLDPETGKVYYLSKLTGKTQWEKPSDMP
eukprot:gene11283-12292_t